MTASPKKLAQSLYVVEIILYLATGFWVRARFDALTAGIAPAWWVRVLKIGVLFALIALAVGVHLQIERWLRSKGWIK